jgi:hypothetical protein
MRVYEPQIRIVNHDHMVWHSYHRVQIEETQSQKKHFQAQDSISCSHKKSCKATCLDCKGHSQSRQLSKKDSRGMNHRLHQSQTQRCVTKTCPWGKGRWSRLSCAWVSHPPLSWRSRRWKSQGRWGLHTLRTSSSGTSSTSSCPRSGISSCPHTCHWSRFSCCSCTYWRSRASSAWGSQRWSGWSRLTRSSPSVISSSPCETCAKRRTFSLTGWSHRRGCSHTAH